MLVKISTSSNLNAVHYCKYCTTSEQNNITFKLKSIFAVMIVLHTEMIVCVGEFTKHFTKKNEERIDTRR